MKIVKKVTDSHSGYIAGVHLLYQSQHYLLNAYFSPPYQSHWQVILANWQEIAAKKVLFPLPYEL